MAELMKQTVHMCERDLRNNQQKTSRCSFNFFKESFINLIFVYLWPAYILSQWMESSLGSSQATPSRPMTKPRGQGETCRWHGLGGA